MVVATRGEGGGKKKHVLKLRTGFGDQEGRKKTCVDIALKVVATRGREKKEKCLSHAMKSCAEIRSGKNKEMC